MKRILSCLLIVVLVLSLFTGCKKKDQGEELDTSNTVSENETGTVDTSTDTELEEVDKEAQEIEYILYLRYKDKPFLYDEYFTVDINDDSFKGKSIDEFVLQQLMNFKPKGEFVTPVPEGTKLLSIKREDNNVLINFSKEFKESKMSKTDAKLAIGGIINSIVALPDNETAQIMVEGEALESFNGVKTSEPLEFMEDLFPDK